MTHCTDVQILTMWLALAYIYTAMHTSLTVKGIFTTHSRVVQTKSELN